MTDLDHPNIAKVHNFGKDGKYVKTNGKAFENLLYIVLEYVAGGLLFDICQTLEGVGEQGGKFFLT